MKDLFADLNAKKQYQDWNNDYYYNQVHTQGHGKARGRSKSDSVAKVRMLRHEEKIWKPQ